MCIKLYLPQVNEIADWLAKVMFDLTYKVLYDTSLADVYKEQRDKFHVDGKPFLWQVSPKLEHSCTCLKYSAEKLQSSIYIM